MYTVYFGVDAVNFLNSVYRVNEREGFLESSLILDKPAKSNLEVSVINFDNNANGELLTILSRVNNIRRRDCLTLYRAV